MNDDRDILKRFEEGIKKFNEGEYYECHDILEDVWFDIRGTSRRFYQGLIHIAVGFYHLTHRNNLNGTISQFTKGIDKLSDYSPEFQGVELRSFLKRVSECVKIVQEMKEGKIEEFDKEKIPRIEFNKKEFKPLKT